MTPHLTSRGLWVFLSAVTFLAAGAIANSAALVVLGQAHVLLLIAAFMMCVAGALALDRRFVAVDVCDSAGEPLYTTSGHTVGKVARIRLRISNRSLVPVFGLKLSGYGSEALGLPRMEGGVNLPARARTWRELDVQPDRLGRWMLQGFDVVASDPLGLLRARDYLPCPHAFEVYPASATGAQSLSHSASRGRRSGGEHDVPMAGHGSVVRELREYQAGDPLRHIAWKATARARRLISREFDRESTLSVYLLVDISPSMRGGAWEGRKLDHTITTAVEYADRVVAGRDRVGLITFDESVFGHLSPGMSQSHLRRLSHHLVGLQTVADPRFAQDDEEALLERVVRYLLVQERLDFRSEQGGVRRELLMRWLKSVEGRVMERYDSPILHEGILDDARTSVAQFAQLRGLDLPYRVEARLGMKERGLREAIDAMVQASGEACRVVVFSDLCSITNRTLVEESIRLAQIQGHRVTFLVPDTPAYYEHSADDPEIYGVVRELFSAAERQERSEMAIHIRQLGVPLSFMRPNETLQVMLQRLDSGLNSRRSR